MSSKDTDQSSSGDSESLDSKDRSGGSGAAGVLMSGGLAASSTLSSTSDAKAENAAGGTATAQGSGAAERGGDGASAESGEGNGASDTAAGGGAAASGGGAATKQAAGGLSGGTGAGIGSRDSSGGNGASARGESGGRGGEAGAAGTGSGASASSASSEGGGTGSGSAGGEGSGSGTGEGGTGSGGGEESGTSSATSSGGGGSGGDTATAANGGGAGGSSSDSGSAGSIGTASASGGGAGSNGASPFSAGSATHGAADGPASVISSPIGATPNGDAFSPVTPVCFCPGTLIATPSGAVAVEDLRPGDQVRLADGGAETVRWIGRQTVEAGTGDPLRTLPIRIRAGAIAPGVPARDLRLSPDHAVALDGVLIHAGALVDGTAVLREWEGPARLRYFHIELPRHALVLAEGLAAESFVDNPERLAFDNWAEREALEDGARAIAEMDLPRAKSARQVPGAIRRRLAARRALLPQAERALVA